MTSLASKALKEVASTCDDVRVGNKVRHRIVATFIGSGFIACTLCSRGNCDFGASDGVALRIVDCANDAAVNSLRGCSGCGKQKTRDNAKSQPRTKRLLIQPLLRPTHRIVSAPQRKGASRYVPERGTRPKKRPAREEEKRPKQRTRAKTRNSPQTAASNKTPLARSPR